MEESAKQVYEDVEPEIPCFITKLYPRDIRLLETIHISDKFRRWVSSEGERGREEAKKLLKERLQMGQEVWIVVSLEKGVSEIIGFALIVNWPGLPRAKAIDAMEVAVPYRRKKIGSSLLRRIINDDDTIYVLMFSPEPGKEVALEKFYRSFDFEFLSGDYMIRFPNDVKKLEKWGKFVDNLLEIYKSLKNKLENKTRMLKAIVEEQKAAKTM